jgi:hypothetical protein
MITGVKGVGSRLAQAVACLLLAATVSVGLGACTHLSPPVGLSDCYEDLPLAEGALDAPRDSYKFSGVKLVTPKVMAELVKRRFPHNPSASYKPPPAGSPVCAFAFTGTFPAGQVATAPAKASGKAAIVLTTTNRTLLFSFVLAKLPETFGRTVTGT